MKSPPLFPRPWTVAYCSLAILSLTALVAAQWGPCATVPARVAPQSFPSDGIVLVVRTETADALVHIDRQDNPDDPEVAWVRLDEEAARDLYVALQQKLGAQKRRAGQVQTAGLR